MIVGMIILELCVQDMALFFLFFGWPVSHYKTGYNKEKQKHPIEVGQGKHTEGKEPQEKAESFIFSFLLDHKIIF